jgi:multicomponent Na+:H+ antiporter subunit B
MTPRQRLWVFLVGAAGLVACYLWAFAGLPGFGNYHGPYGQAILRQAVEQTHATGVVSAVNFEYRSLDTVGEEFILFTAAAGMSVVLRMLRGERERPPLDEPSGRERPPTSSAVRVAGLLLVGPTAVIGWWLASHAQTSPSGGFQGGAVLATAFVLVYLSGEFLAFRRFSPVALLDAVEALGAGGFAAIGLTAVVLGLPYLYNFLPLGQIPGAVSSSGTIALISFFVGLEVAAAFVLIVSELLEQTLLVRQRSQQSQRSGLCRSSRSSSWPGSWRSACTASSQAATSSTRSCA